MTAPRLLLRGATYLVTRRTLRREFLLRPGKLPNQIFGYLLARAAQVTGIQVHCFCFMSNHYHLVVTDPDARLPEFGGYLDSLIARAVNALYGLDGTFWEGGSFNATRITTPHDIVDRCAYALANPVAAGLVRKGRQWPGLWSGPDLLGARLEFERPAHFFSEAGHMPREVVLELVAPPGFDSVGRFREELEEAWRAKERAATDGRPSVLGVARVLKQRIFDRPARPKRRGGLRPRFAARDLGRRVDLARQLKTFLARYQHALQEWRAGRRETVFPEGTYQMRVLHQVACAGAG